MPKATKLPDVHKLSQPYTVGNKTLTELQVKAPGGVLRTGLLLQLLGEFQSLFPGIYDAAAVKISDFTFVTLALAKFNGLTLEELQELPVPELLPAVGLAISFLYVKPEETKT
jgi:hypothetical protein